MVNFRNIPTSRYRRGPCIIRNNSFQSIIISGAPLMKFLVATITVVTLSLDVRIMSFNIHLHISVIDWINIQILILNLSVASLRFLLFESNNGNFGYSIMIILKRQYNASNILLFPSVSNFATMVSFTVDNSQLLWDSVQSGTKLYPRHTELKPNCDNTFVENLAWKHVIVSRRHSRYFWMPFVLACTILRDMRPVQNASNTNHNKNIHFN